jgi:hypothetical protein
MAIKVIEEPIVKPKVEEKKSLETKFGLPTPINNTATTGMSITKGNYLNLPRTDTQRESVPTWK